MTTGKYFTQICSSTPPPPLLRLRISGIPKALIFDPGMRLLLSRVRTFNRIPYHAFHPNLLLSSIDGIGGSVPLPLSVRRENSKLKGFYQWGALEVNQNMLLSNPLSLPGFPSTTEEYLTKRCYSCQ